MARNLAFLLPIFLVLAGCTTTSDYGRTRLVTPPEVGAVYSEVEMRTKLLFASDKPCQGRECESAAAFRRYVQRLGVRLDAAAQGVAADMNAPAPTFVITVSEKSDQGTLSSARGNIVVYDGLRGVGFEEPAMAFLIAREMGHVMERHYDENSATNIIFSVIGSLLMPVTNLIRGAAATLPASSTMAATTTAASMAGSSIVKGVYRPEQLREADTLALKIMMRAGWTPTEVADALQAAAPRLNDEGWMGELQVSKTRLDQITMGPPWQPQNGIAVAAVGSRGIH